MNKNSKGSVKMNLSLTCDVGDFQPWIPDLKDFGSCFLYICMEMPVYGILAVVSAYYMGKRRLSYTCYTAWNSRQSMTIYCRAFIVGILAIIPDASSMIRLAFMDKITTLEGFVIFCKTLAWFLHLLYILRLKRGVSFNTRGPKAIIFSWFLTAVISTIILRSRYTAFYRSKKLHPDENMFLTQVWVYTACTEWLFQGLYFLTLIPGDSLLDERHYRALHNDMRDTHETHAYLNREDNSYVGFHDDDQEMELGTAKENESIISKLLFWWVTPILMKGSCGFLRDPDDLHDLPPELTTKEVASRFQSWAGKNYSLLKTLHLCFGWEFYLIGILKLGSDILGFCGPLLLNELVQFVETSEVDSTDGYYYVGGLLLVTAGGALCNAHFNMGMVQVNLKIKAAVMTEIYRKVLALRKVEIQRFSSGEIINFLNTDTSRIVNSCASFHSLWSQPLQVGIALYLLYQQLGISFLAGVIFVIILIPINRVLAKKIGMYSQLAIRNRELFLHFLKFGIL